MAEEDIKGLMIGNGAEEDGSLGNQYKKSF